MVAVRASAMNREILLTVSPVHELPHCLDHVLALTVSPVPAEPH
jgi:hypothetical protein